MITLRSTIFIIVAIHLVQCTSLKDVFTDSSKNIELSIVRIPRKADDTQVVAEKLEIPLDNVPEDSSVVRKPRDSKYFTDRYGSGTKASSRSLKPEDNPEDSRNIKGNGSLEKRCSTCDTGYLKSTSYGSDRWRDRFDRDPYYSSSKFRYDPYDRYDKYDRYDRDRYYDGYDDYDRDFYRDSRGRNRYSSSYYEPRDRYYDRGLGYDNRGYDYKDYRNNYSPYYRDRYDGYYSPSEDYYVRGYDSLSRGYYTRPDYGNGYYGGYARGYSYGGDRNRYGNGYGSGSSSGYGSGSSRSKYPYEYDSGYRYTSYLYERPSSSTTDMPKLSESDMNTPSPSQSSSTGRS